MSNTIESDKKGSPLDWIDDSYFTWWFHKELYCLVTCRGAVYKQSKNDLLFKGYMKYL